MEDLNKQLGISQEDALESAKRLHKHLHSVPCTPEVLADALSSMAKLGSNSKNAKVKFSILTLLVDWLDLAQVERFLVDAIRATEIPAVGVDGEVRSALMAFLGHIWKPPLRVGCTKTLMNVIRTCKSHFGDRIMGSDTFEFEGYLHTGCHLGKGGEGDVYLGFNLVSGDPVAIKCIRIGVVEQPGFEERLARGVEFLRSTQHPSIVRLYHLAKTPSCWYQYLEFIDGENFEATLRKCTVFKEGEARELFRKLLEPVAFLRTQQVGHRDLKPSNFMITRAGQVKLVDFATMHEAGGEPDLATTFVGTPMYLAPEVWAGGRQPYSVEKADVWSMGVMLYEMLCGKVPWTGRTPQEYFQNVVHKPVEMPLGASKLLCDLLRRVLQLKPALRLSLQEFLHHEWFSVIDTSLVASSIVAGGGGGGGAEDLVLRLQLRVAELEAENKRHIETVLLKDGLLAKLTQTLANIDTMVSPQQEQVNRQLVRLQDGNVALEKRCKQLGDELHAVQQDRDALDAARAANAKQLEQQVVRGNELARQLEEWTQRSNEAQRALDKMRVDFEAAKAQATFTISQMESSAEEIARLNERITLLDDEKRQALEQVAQASAELPRAQAQVEELRNALQASDARHVAMEAQVRERVAERDLARRELEAVRAEAAQLRVDIQRCAQTEANLKEKVTLSAQQVVRLQEELQRSAARGRTQSPVPASSPNASLESRCKAQADQIATLEAQRAKLQKELAESTQLLEEMLRSSGGGGHHHHSKDEYQSLLAQYQKAQQEVQRLANSEAQHRSYGEDVARRHEELQRRFDAQRAESENVSITLREVMQAQDGCGEQIARLQEENSDLKQQIQTLEILLNERERQ